MRYALTIGNHGFGKMLYEQAVAICGKQSGCSFVDGETGRDFTARFSSILDLLQKDDQLIVLSDDLRSDFCVQVQEILKKRKMEKRALILYGCNVPLAVSCFLMKDSFDTFASLSNGLLAEGRAGIGVLDINPDASQNVYEID